MLGIRNTYLTSCCAPDPLFAGLRWASVSGTIIILSLYYNYELSPAIIHRGSSRRSKSFSGVAVAAIIIRENAGVPTFIQIVIQHRNSGDDECVNSTRVYRIIYFRYLGIGIRTESCRTCALVSDSSRSRSTDNRLIFIRTVPMNYACGRMQY